MAQFDVHRNPGARSAALRPFLVDVQSNRHAHHPFRLVVVLVRRSALPRLDTPSDTLAPDLVVVGQEVFLNPFEITPVPADRLGPPVASFAADEEARRRIQRALDEVLAHY